MEKDTKAEVILSVRSAALQRQVLIHKKNWQEHIVQNHEEVWQHLNGLIKKALESGHPDVVVFEKMEDASEVLLYHECPHFKPFHSFLKIAIKLVGDVGYVKSIYPVGGMQIKGLKPYGSH